MTADDPEVPRTVHDRVAERARAARADLEGAAARRRRALDRLAGSTDPEDQAVARVLGDYVRQADEVVRAGAALVLAAGPDGDPVVGRMAVLDEDRDVTLVSWHSPVGQEQLLADDRLLVSERGDGDVTLHTLRADDARLAGRIRASMRTSAAAERMSDPLATLTVEQADVLRAIGRARGDVVLHGPPGSGKTAIVMVELARRVLSDPQPGRFRALFVTGTERLARRADALGRLLGTASIEPIPQADLLRFLGIADDDTPAADAHTADGSLDIPRALEAAYRDLARRLHADVEVPHPLMPVPADEVDAIRRWRARSASTGYRELARGLRRDLRQEYTAILPGERGERAADAAAELLRPDITPSGLVATALDGRRLARPLRTAAVVGATALLERPGGRPDRRFDLVVVDEYQRLPGVAIWLLQRLAGTVLLSGDPMQSFATGRDGRPDAVTTVSLRTSLRLPDAVSGWIDRRWRDAGLDPPEVRSAVAGGEVVEVPRGGPLPPAAQAIAPAEQADGRDGWLSPAEAVGLEWPEVALVDPDGILEAHGPAGLFIASTRAIDRLHVVAR